MQLKPSNLSYIEKFAETRPSANAALSMVPPTALRLAQGFLLLSDMGDEIGFFLSSPFQTTDPDYANALLAVWVDEEAGEEYHRLLANIMRSLRLSSTLVRSDDTRNIKALLHFCLEYHHVVQVYALPSDLSDDEEAEPLTFAEAVGNIPKDYLTPADPDMAVGALLFNLEDVDRIYALSSGKSVLAYVATLHGGESGSRFIFPAVKGRHRRSGYGSIALARGAAMVRQNGLTPLVGVKPAYEAARRFIEYNRLTPLYDYLRVEPRFHLVPLPPVFDEAD